LTVCLQLIGEDGWSRTFLVERAMQEGKEIQIPSFYYFWKTPWGQIIVLRSQLSLPFIDLSSYQFLAWLDDWGQCQIEK